MSLRSPRYSDFWRDPLLSLSSSRNFQSATARGSAATPAAARARSNSPLNILIRFALN